MSDYEMREIANRIKSRREELGLSLSEMAEKCSITRTTLYRYETGYIHNVPLGKLKELAEALEVSPAWLMGWAESEVIIETRGLNDDDIRRLRDYAELLRKASK